MKNNTKIRLHLSKQLFESIAREVLLETKKANMSGGAYTEAVKMPKASKSAEKMTNKMKGIKEVNATADTQKMRKMHEMSSKQKMAKGLYKENEMDEMQINVAEDGQLDEFIGTETADSGVIAALATLLGVGVPLATGLIKHLRQAKTPEEKKKVIQNELPGKEPVKEFIGTETADSGVIAALATLLGVGVPLATGLIKHLRQAKTPEEKKQVLQKELPGKEKEGTLNELRKKK